MQELVEDDNPSKYKNLIYIPVLGWLKNPKKVSAKEYGFLLFSTVYSLFLMIVFFIQLVIQYKDIFSILFSAYVLLNAGFHLVYAYGGVLKERKVFIVYAVIYAAILYAYFISTYFALVYFGNDTSDVILIGSSVLSPLVIILGLFILWKYHKKWNYIFHLSGANSLIQNKAQDLIQCTCYLIMDLNGNLNFAFVCFLPYLSESDKFLIADVIVTTIFVCCTFISFILTMYLLKSENITYFYIVVALNVVMEALKLFTCYKFSKQLAPNAQKNWFICGFCASLYVISFVIKIIIASNLKRVINNFGCGANKIVFLYQIREPEVENIDLQDSNSYQSI